MLNTALTTSHFLPVYSSSCSHLVSHAGLHFLHTDTLSFSHPGAVGDVILRARYYAFISKYLDSTDLFLRRRRCRRSSFFSSLPCWLALSPFRPCFFPLYAHTGSHYPSLLSLLVPNALLSRSHLTALLFPHLASSTVALPYYCFALANLEPRWRRLTEFLIRNILPAFRKVPSFHPDSTDLPQTLCKEDRR